MSVINKIPRGLRVLIVIAILCVLVWKFASGSYFYPGIGAAIIITAIIIFITYRSPNTSSSKTETKKKKKTSAENDSGNLISDEKLEPEPNEENPEPATRVKPLLSVKKAEVKPAATDIAAKYFQMSKTIEKNRISDDWQPAPKSSQSEIKQPELKKEESISEEAPTAEAEQADDSSEQTPITIVEDESTLSIEDQNQLVNAVWYRCENPFCKHTRFLGVHHILDEKEGGTNKLNNLIVLCPYCHDLAHKKEIPEEEMQAWIADREERFKFKPVWHY
jgi:hypothetical protein